MASRKANQMRKNKLLLRNKLVNIKFSKEVKPNWLGQEKIQLPILGIKKNTAAGKTLIWATFNNKKYPAVVKTSYGIQDNLNIKDTLKRIIYEQYYKKNEPFYMRIPVHYHWIPQKLRITIFKIFTKEKWKKTKFPKWPIEMSIEALRESYYIIQGKRKTIKWLGNKKYGICFSHDIDTKKGLEQIPKFLKIEKKYGVKATWFLVGCYYSWDKKIIEMILKTGGEIALHGYNHDNKIAFLNEGKIDKRIKKCLDKIKKYNIRGFRSPSLLRTEKLDRVISKYFVYDSSRPDTEINSLIASRNGCCTVFPFYKKNLLIIPITVPQDSIMQIMDYPPEKILITWLKKIKWIKKVGGIAVINTHPEPHFSGNKKMIKIYEELLKNISQDKEAKITTLEKIAKGWPKNVYI